MKAKVSGGWKPGPLPPKTGDFGGVQLHAEVGTGFHVCEFKGDHAVLLLKGNRRVEAWEISQYNNSVAMPPRLAK